MKFQGIRPEVVGDYVALALCLLIFLFSLPGFGGASTPIAAIFFLIIPGYGFTRAFFPKSPILDKMVMTIAMSIGVSTFTQSFLEVFLGDMAIPVMPILSAISMILIVYVIVRDRL